MATPSSKSNLLHWLLRVRRAPQRGFTLIELLVTLIVGSLIMGSLLYLVVELMQANRREEVLSQTQQDMRRALDYMTRDVRQAVFVYDSPNAIVEPDKGATAGTKTLLDQLDDLPDGEAILAFWRLDPVPPESAFWDKDKDKDKPCDTFPEAKRPECTTLRIRQSYYTLVVYLLQDNDDSDFWGGPARIIRYELPKYSISDIPTLTQRKGYSDPTGCATFANWGKPPGWDSASPCDAANNGTTKGTAPVLTDSVSTNGLVVSVDGTTNKTVTISLQGDALTRRPGLVTAFSNASALPRLESEVLVRGVLNKQPTQ
jgi:prepilin-type N-terminal cleavage/methylation domain-containing protein